MAPDSACEGRSKRGGQEEPGQPGEQALAEKAARVPAAAGDGKPGRAPGRSAVAVVARGVGVPVSGTNHRPTSATAPSADEHEVGQGQRQLPHCARTAGDQWADSERTDGD